MDTVKVEGILQWPALTCKTKLQVFLSFTNFYCQFIKDFTKLAHPLHELTGNMSWSWSTEHKSAFDQIKHMIGFNPMLSFPLNDAPYRVEADSSDFATGAVLPQLQDGKWM